MAKYPSTMWKTATRLLFSLGSSPSSRQRSNADDPFPDAIAARVYWRPISFAETAVIIVAPRPGIPPPSTAEPSGNATANSLGIRSATLPTWTKNGSRPPSSPFSTPSSKTGLPSFRTASLSSRPSLIVKRSTVKSPPWSKSRKW